MDIRRKISLIGIDIEEQMIEQASLGIKGAPNIELVNGDVAAYACFEGFLTIK